MVHCEFSHALRGSQYSVESDPDQTLMYAPDRQAKVGGSSANLNRKVSAAGHQMRPSNEGEVRERNREDDEGRRRLGLKRCNPAWGRGNGPMDSDSDSEDNVTVQSHKASHKVANDLFTI